MHRIFLALLALGLFPSETAPLRAAEYEGRNIDGQHFNCTAHRVGTKKRYYYGTVVFTDNELTFYFNNEPFFTATMPDDLILDAHSISAFDYEHDLAWNLNVHNLE